MISLKALGCFSEMVSQAAGMLQEKAGSAEQQKSSGSMRHDWA